MIPGSHKLVVERAGRFPWSSQVEVPAGGQLEIRLTSANMPERLGWPSYFAYGTGAAATLCLVAGGFLGVASEIEPTLDTRAEVMRDFERRRTLGRAATA